MDRLGQIRRRYAVGLQSRLGLRSSSLVEALATVPRERFVGGGPWLVSSGGGEGYRETPDADAAHLYDDVMVALDADRELNNGNPRNHARWLDRLDVNSGDHVVHVGAGTGYYTAILAALVGETGKVTAAEIDPRLLPRLRENTAALRQVRIVAPRGLDIAFEDADRIYVNCALTRPPADWLGRLRDGGTMIMPLTEMGPQRHGGVFWVRRLRSAYAAAFIVRNRMFPCEGGRYVEDEPAIAAAFERGGEDTVRSLRSEAHPVAPDCWLHAQTFCLSQRRAPDA